MTKEDFEKIDKEVEHERTLKSRSIKPYETALASAIKNLEKELKDFDEITDADERERAIRDIKDLKRSIEIYKRVIKMRKKD